MASYTVKCFSCQNVGVINKISAQLTCTCGSRDIDLIDPAEITFLEFMGVTASSGGTGWNHTMPDPLDGWDEYAGPPPGANPFSAPAPNNPFACQECQGTKVDVRDGGTCRACKGTGTRTPTTAEAPEPMVKRHDYPSTQTKIPFMGRHRSAAPERTLRSPEEVIKHTTPGWAGNSSDPGLWNVSPHLKTRDDNAAAERYSDEGLASAREKGYPMHEASCPECGHAPTHLVNSPTGAWWHCPNCGPLENIDKHPEVDPYNPPTDFKPNPRSFKASGRRRKPTVRVFEMVTVVAGNNPGLSNREVVTLVRRTAQKYPE
jgi:uncharacterized Zn finger protein (UPF0148 family)